MELIEPAYCAAVLAYSATDEAVLCAVCVALCTVSLSFIIVTRLLVTFVTLFLVTRPNDERHNRGQHGLARTLINNMIIGVTTGFEKKLQLVGVGYKAEKKGDTLVMSLGYSHPVEMKDPEGITTECPSQTEVTVKGIDKALVGNYAANIRAWRKPEPYKGKGIKYVDEVIRRKEGKAGAK
jgi:large subunit ribosomal protein L6